MDAISIRIDFTGAGHYYLSDGVGSIDLGQIDNEGDLRDAVQECVEAGSGDESWDGWTAARD